MTSGCAPPWVRSRAGRTVVLWLPALWELLLPSPSCALGMGPAAPQLPPSLLQKLPRGSPCSALLCAQPGPPDTNSPHSLPVPPGAALGLPLPSFHPQTRTRGWDGVGSGGRVRCSVSHALCLSLQLQPRPGFRSLWRRREPLVLQLLLLQQEAEEDCLFYLSFHQVRPHDIRQVTLTESLCPFARCVPAGEETLAPAGPQAQRSR